jgi:hypothetical protein
MPFVSARKTITYQQDNPPSEGLSGGLEAVISLLERKQTLESLTPFVSPPVSEGDLIAVFFREWEVVHHAFVIDGSSERNAYPCIKLSRFRKEWIFEPFLFCETPNLETVRVPFTQKKMEEFFRNDAHFPNATLGFFTEEYARMMGY